MRPRRRPREVDRLEIAASPGRSSSTRAAGSSSSATPACSPIAADRALDGRGGSGSPRPASSRILAGMRVDLRGQIRHRVDGGPRVRHGLAMHLVIALGLSGAGCVSALPPPVASPPEAPVSGGKIRRQGRLVLVVWRPALLPPEKTQRGLSTTATEAGALSGHRQKQLSTIALESLTLVTGGNGLVRLGTRATSAPARHAANRSSRSRHLSPAWRAMSGTCLTESGFCDSKFRRDRGYRRSIAMHRRLFLVVCALHLGRLATLSSADIGEPRSPK